MGLADQQKSREYGRQGGYSLSPTHITPGVWEVWLEAGHGGSFERLQEAMQ